MARRRGRLRRHEPQDTGPFTDFLWPFAASLAVLALVAGLALAWDQIPPVREARARVLGAEGQITVESCRRFEGQGEAEALLSCSGRFVSADGLLVIPRIQVHEPALSDVDRVAPAWVTGPEAQEAYVRVHWVSAGTALILLVVIELWLLWLAVMLLLGSSAGWASWRRSRRGAPADDILLSEPVLQALAAHAARAVTPAEGAAAPKAATPSPTEAEPADPTDAGAPPGQRTPRSPVAAVILIVLGLAIAAGPAAGMAMIPFSPFQQLRARYFGLTGVITHWDCHAETYQPRRGSAYPVLACTGSFRSTAGTVADGLGIYQPREQDIGQQVVAWMADPHARWAFTSVEWGFAVTEVIVLVLLLVGGVLLVRLGVRRLMPRRNRTTGG